MSVGQLRADLDAALAGLERDFGRVAREMEQFFSVLGTTEKLVLVGLTLLGLFYLLIRNVQRRRSEEQAEQRFVGLLLVVLTFAVGLGWIVADRHV
jgi:NhaP-type Na+/H+ or K+/H+ antiporter